jgi:GrpB-like predicted nucleotidyltransferase (UPF0157 family)
MAAVVLVPYRAEWPAMLAGICSELRAVLPGDGWTVEHIGSTSVPGLVAKPVIDIMLGVPSLAYAETNVDALARAGFEYVSKYNTVIPERRYFVRPRTRPRLAHMHAVVEGGRLWQDHLLFRDALRRDGETRQAYQDLKQEMAARFAHDAAAYTDAKAAFIQGVMNRARMAAPSE